MTNDLQIETVNGWRTLVLHLAGGGASDAEVITQSLTDPDRFVEIFDRYFDVIQLYIYRRIGADLADDLAAQTFVEAYACRGSYIRDREDARPWLYGIAANLVRRHRRTEERRLRAYGRSKEDEFCELDIDSTVDMLDANLAGPALAKALAALNPGDRDVLTLYALAGLSHSEIGVALGLSDGTVASRLNRARRKSRKYLRSLNGGINRQLLGGEGNGRP